MYFLIENAANRLEFLTVSDKEMPEGKADQMKLSAKPRFLIYKDGVCHKEVDGVLINDIENEVNRLLPPSDDWLFEVQRQKLLNWRGALTHHENRNAE